MQKNKIKNIYKNYLAVKEAGSTKWSEDFFFNFFMRKDSFFFSSKNFSEGYLIARKISDDFEIISVVISSDFRRRGIATYLLKQLFLKAKKNKINKVFIEVRQNNYPALQMYKKLGFLSTGFRKNYYKTSLGFDNALTMVKLII